MREPFLTEQERDVKNSEGSEKCPIKKTPVVAGFENGGGGY